MSGTSTSEILAPSPIAFAPSQDWDGNDGPWSSFALRIGNLAQNVKVFPSTSGYQILTVAPEGCTSRDPSSCASSRGNIFNTSESRTWQKDNITSSGIFNLALEENLGYSGTGLYGYDTVGLDWQGSEGPTLDQQLVAGIATKSFYLGLFGLDPRPTNFTEFENPVPSYLSNLFNQSKIPSLAWGYTAGNQYRNQEILGSLTLGGYDASRFIPNEVSFDFNQRDARALSVPVNGISFESNDTTSVLLDEASKISALIDSTVPYIYLPLQVCENFEKAFGIEWNDTVQAYLVNDTLHTSLQRQNATVTFTLGPAAGSGSVNISLPYAAFDLNASAPLVTQPTRYFPLMRAQNDTQFTLGRTFLQEAYLTADYERRNFSVSQCDWASENAQDIKSILSPTLGQQNGTLPFRTTRPSSKSSSAGAIGGGVAGGVVGLILILGAILIFLRKRRHNKTKDIETDYGKPELDAGEKPIIPEAEGDETKDHMIDGKPHGELDSGDAAKNAGSTKWKHELPGSDGVKHELESPNGGKGELQSPDQPDHELESPTGLQREMETSPSAFRPPDQTMLFELPGTRLSFVSVQDSVVSPNESESYKEVGREHVAIDDGPQNK